MGFALNLTACGYLDNFRNGNARFWEGSRQNWSLVQGWLMFLAWGGKSLNTSLSCLAGRQSSSWTLAGTGSRRSLAKAIPSLSRLSERRFEEWTPPSLCWQVSGFISVLLPVNGISWSQLQALCLVCFNSCVWWAVPLRFWRTFLGWGHGQKSEFWRNNIKRKYKSKKLFKGPLNLLF